MILGDFDDDDDPAARHAQLDEGLGADFPMLAVNGVAVDEFEPELGVLFIDFHVDGDPYEARGYFKNLTGEMIDEFTIFAEH